jgi:phosphoribosylformylglycinamidine synthase PurS subunit
VTRYAATIEIRGLEGLADPEGQTIERALPALGFSGVDSVHVGKLITLRVDAIDVRVAHNTVQRLCDRLLANPVIEEATFTLDDLDAPGAEVAPEWGPV